MANYTITLADLVKAKYPIFDDSWYTFNREHKQELCDKIIRHYYFYEIGQETPDRFRHYLNEHLALIMPLYNRLYASEMIKIEPVYDRWVEETTGVKRDKGRRRRTTGATDFSRLREVADSLKRMSEGTSDMVGNRETVGHEDWKEDRVIHTTEVTDQDTTENTKKDVKFSEEVTDEKTEKMTDNIDGTRTVDSTTTIDTTTDVTTSNTKRYSDTPQAQISADGMAIEQSYLTNYTRENGTSNTVGHSSEIGHSDEKTHSEEEKNTTTNETKNTGSEQNTTQDVKGTNDVTKNIDTKDNATGSRDSKENMGQTENVNTTGTERQFSDGMQKDKERQSSVGMEEIDDTENENAKNVMKGFTVSQAELLKMYRSSFLNIDEMIIKELAVNFMGVF